MKQKIRIVSSSFLMPNNLCWSKLSKQSNKIFFEEIGDYFGAISKLKKNESLVITIFLRDFLESYLSGKSINYKILKKIISSACEKTDRELILTLSTWQKYSVIANSREEYEYIINKDKLIKEIRTMQKTYKNLYYIDLDNFFAEVGYTKSFDERNYFLFNCRLSNLGLQVLADQISEIFWRLTNPQMKVLVFDCDNTLWGGVLGEVGFKNIQIGQDGVGKIFSCFQDVIKNLSNKGYLIAIASKNNEEDVKDVFSNHKLMKLKKKDIISFKVNWNEKYKNLIDLSKELNLGLDSFLFWDDNILERNKMKTFLPEVNTINVPDDISKWPEFLSSEKLINKFNFTLEDTKKKHQYTMLSKFNFGKEKIKTQKQELSFLKSIKVKPKVIKINKSTISRAAQLTQKTNQFNFRTKRYSESDIENIIKDKNNFAFLTNLKDQFGDHGIISLAILKKINQDYCFLDTMLMSCRILGRYVDNWILNECRNIAKKNKFKYIISEFIRTDKNKDFESSLKTNGFYLIDKKFLKRKKININSDNKLFITNVKKFTSNYDKIFK